jgi:hypothetical protein
MLLLLRGSHPESDLGVSHPSSATHSVQACLVNERLTVGSIFIPVAEVVHGIINGPSRLIARIDFRMYNMRLRQSQRQEIVNMCREALEAGLVSHETMYVYKKQLPTTFVDRLDRQERVHR